jgi:hypothetical protein
LVRTLHSELARYMDGKYIPVKVNIDDFDGFAYKQKYKISLLPTLMVLNCEGKEIERKEEGLVPRTLSIFLGKHYQPENICEAPPVSVPHPKRKPSIVIPDEQEDITNPYDTYPDPSSENHSPNEGTVTTPPPPATVPKPKITPPPPPKEEERPEPYVHIPPPTTSRPEPDPTPPPPSYDKPKRLEEGLFRFQVQRQPSQGYSVQTGVFGEYSNVLREVSKLQKLFQDQPIIVFIGNRNGRTIYKVLVGEFENRTETYAYREKIKRAGIAGIIKSLAYMK